MGNKGIYFIGVSNGLKPQYIIEKSLENPAFQGNTEDICYITDDSKGMAVEFCEKMGIRIIIVDPYKMESAISIIKSQNPQLLIAIGWSYRIPKNFLDVFTMGAINCHGGLLPDYRGNNVYMHNYANISENYGATIHFMNQDFDDGNIIVQASAKLYLEETPLILHRRICEMTAWILPQAIALVSSGYRGKKQVGKARYFYKIDRITMEKIRQTNIERIMKQEEKNITNHKEWYIKEGDEN